MEFEKVDRLFSVDSRLQKKFIADDIQGEIPRLLDVVRVTNNDN